LDDRIQNLEGLLQSALRELEDLRMTSGTRLPEGEAGPCSDCFEVLDVMGMLRTSPEAEELLDTIIDVATVSIGAEAGSILLLDEAETHLVFAAVHGEKASDLKHFKLAIGQGIAGFVVASGQPLCVQDVAENEQWDRSIAEAVQFETHSILAVPVVCGSRVLGVLETVNKLGGGGFLPGDMEILSQFAKIAGAAVEKRNMLLMGQSLLTAAKERLRADEVVPGGKGDVLAAMVSGLETMRASDEYRLALEIAAKIVNIAARSRRDAELCLTVLNAFQSRLESPTHRLGFGGPLKK
jgi:transcriptional regulator with GAF, ATPase, and Fis domain